MPGRLDIDGLLIDIDGVLTVSWDPIDGVPDALATVRASGLPLRFATNTTTRTRGEVAELLRDAGMPVDVDEILTAPAATAAHLRRAHPGERVFLLNTGDLSADLDGIDLVDHGPADVVVIGGAGVDFTHQQLNEAFRLILDGAAFVAMHRNTYWRTAAGLELDTGATFAPSRRRRASRRWSSANPRRTSSQQVWRSSGLAPTGSRWSATTCTTTSSAHNTPD